MVIKADRAKDEMARQNGYTPIRFPYWLQLTEFTLSHFFGLSAEIVQDFPHGFITTKLFPASYCEMGVERFEREFLNLPLELKTSVVASLNERAKEHGAEYVLPKTLQHLWKEPSHVA